MSDKFNEALKRIDEENEQGEICPCCAIREDIINSMIHNIFEIVYQEGEIEDIGQELGDYLNDVYLDIHSEGRRDAFEHIAGFAHYNIDRIDGDVEED